MQIKIFSIPTYGGEEFNKEMNDFLRSKKVLSLESKLVTDDQNGAYWSFCAKYIDGVKANQSTKIPIDYRKKLDAESYERYKKMREIRSNISKKEAVAAFFILTNEEMAELAKLKNPTHADMIKIKGIGQKKMEKYGDFFIVDANKKK